jgi:hypothetical protein
LIYEAGSHALFNLPYGLSGVSGTDDGSWAVRRMRLPCCRDGKASETVTWRDFAGEAVWNYNEFLIGTRA